MRYSDKRFRVFLRNTDYFDFWEEEEDVIMTYAPSKDDLIEALVKIGLYEPEMDDAKVARPFGIVGNIFILECKSGLSVKFEVIQ